MFARKNIKRAYIKICGKIKNFLLSTKSREFLFFLLFFLVASAFWLMQTLNDYYDAELSVPVRLKNVPNNVVLTSEPVAELQVTVKDKGSVLLNYMFGKSIYPVNLDFNDYKGVDNHVSIGSAEYEKKVQSQLNASTRLVAIRPDTLKYVYSTGQSKPVPVKLQGKVSAARQYYISDPVFTPDTVLVYAPKQILDTIRYAYTEIVSLENISDTLIKQIRLNRVKGAKFVPDQVSITLPVDFYTEKTVEVPVLGINFPNDRVLRTFPSKVQITFQVGLSRFKDISEEDFAINVSYQDILKLKPDDKYTVRLNKVPKGINNIRISPAEIDFLIEQISVNAN